MVPMTMIQFELDGGAPTEAQLRDALRGVLGARAAGRIEEIDVSGSRVRLLSQDAVALVYAAKVCADLGGAVIRSGGGPPFSPPAWTAIPWPEHSWFSRLRIRLGRLRV